MKYKALMIDLDGTTVPHFTDNASERVVQAVIRAHDVVSVSLVTGRPLPMTVQLIEKLQITGPCVLLNGAQIYDPGKKEIVRELQMTQEEADYVYSHIHSFSDSLVVHDGKKDLKGELWKELEHVVSFYLFDVSPAIVASIVKIFENHPSLTTNRMLGSKPGLEAIEVINKQATKQFGIYEVAKLLNISTHEIIGVGDGYNDFALLMACGLKVAMGNAVPELKAVADFIAPSVDEDGLAVVIEKFILE